MAASLEPHGATASSLPYPSTGIAGYIADMARYQHLSPSHLTNPVAYEQGLRQAALSIERYHYLCAAVQQKYALVDNVPPDLSLGQLFPRQALVFEQYEPCRLKPLEGIKLHPREDGSIHPGDVEAYQGNFKSSWKHLEGGILYNIGDPRSFYNCIFNYHSPAGTTGNPEWDTLFQTLKANGFSKSIIPCMVSQFGLASSVPSLTGLIVVLWAGVGLPGR